MTLVLVNGGWADAAVPYVIDEATFTSAELAIVQDGISRWNNDPNSLSPLVDRTVERDYLNFRRHRTACNSPLGKQGGRQEVLCAIGAGFDSGSIMHEIGHSMGLFHEHQRADRNNFVSVNIASNDSRAGNYIVRQGDSIAAFGAYDLGSIMHHPPRVELSVTVPVPPGVTVGQRDALSAGDRGGLEWLRRDFFKEAGTLRQVSVSSDGMVWG